MKTNEQQPEAALQGALAANLDDNFESLVRLYQDRLYAFALRLSDSTQDAEEIAQDALVRAYRALQGYDPERIHALAMRAWLYQITLNVYRNRVRGRRLPTVPLDGEIDDDGNWEPAGQEADRPEALAERTELRAELAGLVAALPERYRAAILLRYMADLSYAEMAGVLGQPVGTVKANVHRGLQRLRAQVGSLARV